jgi:eukaryotic-like serine/threonine-protein kinase
MQATAMDDVTKSAAEMRPSPSAKSPLSEEPPLRRVGSYRIVAPLAAGGGGSVWLALDEKSPELLRVVAVKFAHRDGMDDTQRRRFLREAKVASAIRHTNVVDVLEAGEENGQPYLVMPYVEGVTLEALSCRGALPVDVVVCIVADALRGLEAAHEARGIDGAPLGVVHRDVSPHNLLVGVDGVTKVTDFGIARPLDDRDRSNTRWAQGKVAYFSPEQSRGEALDRRSDLFSLGTILWECLVGRRLFRDEDPFITAHRVQTQKMVPPSVARETVPPELDDVTLRALARDRDERWSTAAEMLDGLLGAAARARLQPRPEVVAEYVRAHAASELASRHAMLRRAALEPKTADSPAAKKRKRWPWVAAGVAGVAALVALGLARHASAGADSRPESVATTPAPVDRAPLAHSGAPSPLPSLANSAEAAPGPPGAHSAELAPSSAPASTTDAARSVRAGARGGRRPADHAPKLPMSANPF